MHLQRGTMAYARAGRASCASLPAAVAITMVLATLPATAVAQDQGPAAHAPPAEAPPALQPPFSVTLAGNPQPLRIDAGLLGPVYLTSAISGLAQVQSNVTTVDRVRHYDLDNAHLFLNKPDGEWQFFLQAGQYSLPALGVPYIRSVSATPTYFTYVPQGVLKWVPDEHWSVMAGKLPTLIGAETTFSFQNMNVQRGLLWNQENAVNRGVQVNYAQGPLTLSASVNDGFYSNRYGWVTLLASYAIDKSNTVTFDAGGNTNHTSVSNTRTPLFQNNQQICNLIYTYAKGPWTVQPYLQFTHVPSLPQFGATDSASTWGGAVLMNYDFGADATPQALRLPGFRLPVRLEYIKSNGSADSGAPNLLYGPGSEAWSFTVSPTYQNRNFFVRGELSWVGTRKTTPGLVFGRGGNKGTQSRAVIELGFLL